MTVFFLLDFQIKEDLLGVIEGLEPESIDTAGLMIEAMSSVTNNAEEISSKAQVCEMSRAHGRKRRGLYQTLDSARGRDCIRRLVAR